MGATAQPRQSANWAALSAASRPPDDGGSERVSYEGRRASRLCERRGGGNIKAG